MSGFCHAGQALGYTLVFEKPTASFISRTKSSGNLSSTTRTNSDRDRTPVLPKICWTVHLTEVSDTPRRAAISLFACAAAMPFSTWAWRSEKGTAQEGSSRGAPPRARCRHSLSFQVAPRTTSRTHADRSFIVESFQTTPAAPSASSRLTAQWFMPDERMRTGTLRESL